MSAIAKLLEISVPARRRSNPGPQQGRVHRREAVRRHLTQILCVTLGAATDLQSEGLRRLLVNAAYWAVNLEDKIPSRANVEYVGVFHPTAYGFNGYKKGVKPSEHELK